MSTTYPAGGETPQPRLLDPVQVGRMIRCLQNDWVTRSSDWRKHRVRRRHTDNKIMEALSLTKQQFDFCLKEYEMSSPGRQWNPSTVQKAFNAFVAREGRWPTNQDCRNWKETGLPLMETFAIHHAIDWCQRDYVREHPKSKVLPQLIMTMTNMTFRRDAVTAYGIENILRAGVAQEVQEDDYGKLWRLPFPDEGDPNMLYVEVVNNSAQKNLETGEVIKDKDGNPVYDHYFLRVPTNTRTAREAVAWTFRLDPAGFKGFSARS